MELKFDTKQKALESKDYFVQHFGDFSKADQLEIVDKLIIASEQFGFDLIDLDNIKPKKPALAVAGDDSGGTNMSKIGDMDQKEFTDLVVDAAQNILDQQVKIAEAQAKISELTSEIESLNSKNSELDAQIAEANEKIASLTTVNSELSTANDELKTQIGDIEREQKTASRMSALTEAGVDIEKLTDKQKDMISQSSDEDFEEWKSVFASLKKSDGDGDGNDKTASANQDDNSHPKDDLATAADALKNLGNDSDDNTDNQDVAVGSLIRSYAQRRGLIRVTDSN